MQITTCIEVNVRTTIFCRRGPKNFIRLLPGSVDLKAINTARVFPRTQEIQRTKVIPNAVWRSIQDQSEGRPMKVREHRKHRVKEKSSRKLSSELLALTIGVFLCLKKINATVAVKQAPIKEDSVRIVPMISVYDKNSVSFFSHSSLLLLDQNSG